MRAPRALGRIGEPAYFVSRAAGSARRGGGHVRCLVTTNRSWFLRKASPRTALVAAVQKPPLPLTLLNRLWPDKRAASPSLNAQARVQTPSKHRRSDLEMRIRPLGFKCAHISERIDL